MTPTDQALNIAVARACNTYDRWVLVKRGFFYAPKANGYTKDINKAWIISEQQADEHVYPLGDDPVTKQRAPVPDYGADLNACHEMEKTLNEKQQVWYLQKLTQVRYKDGVSGMIACMIDKTTFATATQRREAFLRTLNLYPSTTEAK